MIVYGDFRSFPLHLLTLSEPNRLSLTVRGITLRSVYVEEITESLIVVGFV